MLLPKTTGRSSSANRAITDWIASGEYFADRFADGGSGTETGQSSSYKRFLTRVSEAHEQEGLDNDEDES